LTWAPLAFAVIFAFVLLVIGLHLRGLGWESSHELGGRSTLMEGRTELRHPPG